MSSIHQSLPTTMRAWTYSRRGTPREVLILTPDHPVPPFPTGSNLLVRVAYAGMNPDGPMIMSMVPPLLSKTRTPELDFSGLIESAGPSVPKDLVAGTRVFGTINPFTSSLLYGYGAMAEFVLVNANDVVRVPDTIRLVDVAGLGAAGQTALKLVRVAALKSNAKVLVNGASGGVGTLLVQILKAEKVEVVATCSAANVKMVESLGADELTVEKVIDYRKHDPLHEYLAAAFKGKPFDAILDTTGSQALYKNSPQYLYPDGPCVNVGNYEGMLRTIWNWIMNIVRPVFLGGTPRRYVMHSTPPRRDAAEELVKMMMKGELRVLFDEIVDMEHAMQVSARCQALRRRTSGRKINVTNS
ncbi:zinc ion binding [Agyrium rufum]|nr:zinc ion binding [Agyrium rufum]